MGGLPSCGAIEGLGHLAQMLFHVVAIHDLQGLREQLGGDVPDPRSPVADHHLARGLPEVPTLGLALDTLGKLCDLEAVLRQAAVSMAAE